MGFSKIDKLLKVSDYNIVRLVLIEEAKSFDEIADTLKDVFHYTEPRRALMAGKLEKKGQTTIFKGMLEHAEFYRDQCLKQHVRTIIIRIS